MPVNFVRSGDSMCFECADASGGQIDATATAQTLAALDFERINPLNGPVYVEGAEPGDALKITINRFYPSGQGWTANIPGFGLLADQFREPSLYLWRYDPVTLGPALFWPSGGACSIKALYRHDWCGPRGTGPSFRCAATSGRGEYGSA